MRRSFFITEEQENAVYQFWIKNGATSKEIAVQFPNLFSSEHSVSRVLTRAIARKRYLLEKSRIYFVASFIVLIFVS